jgi:putative transcriptional regulator
MLKNRLKHFRHKHEMNQKQFADFLGVQLSLYNRWELQTKQPNLESAWKLSQKLNCTINELFYEAPE